MDYLRRSEDRGTANFGWLQSRHSFSFGNYYNSHHMGISALRVINDDTVSAGAGFDTHNHADMEILTYVLQGSIEHRDSLGNRFVVPAGEIQRMSAGTGITHSEYNASDSETLKFLQIWIVPDRRGVKPGYQQAAIQQTGAMTTLVSPDGRDGSLSLNQDACVSRLVLQPNQNHRLSLGARAGYLHIIEGGAIAEQVHLNPGDGVGLTHTRELNISARDDGLVALWFDLPAVAA